MSTNVTNSDLPEENYELPFEILVMIFDMCDKKSFINIVLTCKWWYGALDLCRKYKICSLWHKKDDKFLDYVSMIDCWSFDFVNYSTRPEEEVIVTSIKWGAKNNNTDVIKWLRSDFKNYNINRSVNNLLGSATRDGDINMLDFIHSTFPDNIDKEIIIPTEGFINLKHNAFKSVKWWYDKVDMSTVDFSHSRISTVFNIITMYDDMNLLDWVYFTFPHYFSSERITSDLRKGRYSNYKYPKVTKWLCEHGTS